MTSAWPPSQGGAGHESQVHIVSGLDLRTEAQRHQMSAWVSTLGRNQGSRRKTTKATGPSASRPDAAKAWPSTAGVAVHESGSVSSHGAPAVEHDLRPATKCGRGRARVPSPHATGLVKSFRTWKKK